MSRTLDAINADSGVTLQTVVAVEGLMYLLTDGDANYAGGAWEAEPGSNYAEALSGLRVTYGIDQRLDPWKPFDASPSRVTLTVMDADGNDVLGAMMFKREATTRTVLSVDVAPDATSIAVKRSDDFGGAGFLHIGCESVQYTTNTTASDTFSTLTRGHYSPFNKESGDGPGRTHYAVPVQLGPDLESTTSTQVADEPTEWRGRWVGVWLHLVENGVPVPRSEAHCVFAGKVAEVSDSEDGSTVISCIGVLDTIRETVILRRQWRGNLREGLWMRAGARFKATDELNGSDKTADDLVVIPAGAATAYELDEGFYSGDDLATKINAWLAQARADGDLNFKYTFRYRHEVSNGTIRSSLTMSDPIGGTQDRKFFLRSTSAAVRIFYGWGAENGQLGEFTAPASTTTFSDFEPLRMWPWGDGGVGDDATLPVENVTGSFVDQTDMMPQGVASTYKGFLRVGGSVFPAASPVVINGTGTITIGPSRNDLFGLERIPSNLRESLPITLDSTGDVEVTQVLCLESSLGVLVLSMLASTGGDNWPAYELLPEHCSAGIPYDLLTDALETEIANAPLSGDSMRLIVMKPTILADLWQASFVLRHVQFVWRQGRIALRGFATPTSAATLTITADDRAADVKTSSLQRSITRQSDEWMRNVITIKSNVDPLTGEYLTSTVFEIPGSVSNHGARPATVQARNATMGIGSAGEDIRALLPTFAAPLAFLSYPATLIKVPIHLNLLEQATPGEVCLFSDDFARDPSTGTRGISGKPALVVSQRVYGWGGESGAPIGEIELMLFPRLSLAPYSPCAQVDDGTANAGYDAGTKTLTCYAHQYSEASGTADAAEFAPGDKVLVVQIDPADPASYLSWQDTVASQTGNTITLTTGLAGWDNTKVYRVISDTYSTAVTAQQSDAYQAGTALIASTRQPYSLSFNPVGQVTAFTSTTATPLAVRPPDVSAGDGRPLDTGHARDIARTINNGISYFTAPQTPELMTEMAYSGSGTRCLIYAAPVYVGVGQVTNQATRKLYVAPWIRSTSGAAATLRVTLASSMPASADPNDPLRDDIVRQQPYVEASFTTSSTTYAIPAEQALDIGHLNLGEGSLGGWGWLLVEATSVAACQGFGVLRLGPLEAP